MDQSYGFQQALVVGTVRNASRNAISDILRVVNSLDSILPTFAFVVESDSEDETVDLLQSLSKRDRRIRYVSLGNVAPSIPDRIARLRHCRNVYVQEIRENPNYQDCDLVIVADLDGINTKISTKYMENALNTVINWDALAANQRARYYDILALRHPLWSPNNWLSESEWFKPFLGEKGARRHSMADRMIRIPSNLAPIEVDSAFGGLCIYQRWVFEKCDYSEDVPGAIDENEHVTLNRKARDFGAKIYIHPGLINAKWTAHSLSGPPLMRLLKSISRNYPFTLLLPILRRLSLLVARRA